MPYRKAIADAFPELEFDKMWLEGCSKFQMDCLAHFFSTQYIGKYAEAWDNTSLRRFFSEFAQEKGFDPLVAENWKTITVMDIEIFGVPLFCLAVPVQRFDLGNSYQQPTCFQGKEIVSRFQGRFRLAIKTAFPELEFDEHWLQGFVC
jgi:hypothetical protein